MVYARGEVWGATVQEWTGLLEEDGAVSKAISPISNRVLKPVCRVYKAIYWTFRTVYTAPDLSYAHRSLL